MRLWENAEEKQPLIGCLIISLTHSLLIKICAILGYVHTVTFLHGFVLFHNPKGIPVYFQTIENDAKTLPCAHSRNFQGAKYILNSAFYSLINITPTQYKTIESQAQYK